MTPRADAGEGSPPSPAFFQSLEEECRIHRLLSDYLSRALAPRLRSELALELASLAGNESKDATVPLLSIVLPLSSPTVLLLSSDRSGRVKGKLHSAVLRP